MNLNQAATKSTSNVVQTEGTNYDVPDDGDPTKCAIRIKWASAWREVGKPKLSTTVLFQRLPFFKAVMKGGAIEAERNGEWEIVGKRGHVPVVIRLLGLDISEMVAAYEGWPCLNGSAWVPDQTPENWTSEPDVVRAVNAASHIHIHASMMFLDVEMLGAMDDAPARRRIAEIQRLQLDMVARPARKGAKAAKKLKSRRL